MALIEKINENDSSRHNEIFGPKEYTGTEWHLGISHEDELQAFLNEGYEPYAFCDGLHYLKKKKV